MFKKYTSIENSSRTGFINDIIEQGFDAVTYVVTEKIHGANFGIAYDGREMIPQKRTTSLNLEDNFYGFQDLVKKYEDDIKKIYKLTGADRIIVYGEIFGGSYPHPDVKRENVGMVQKGVYYNPKTDMIAFDILLGKDGDSSWVSYETVLTGIQPELEVLQFVKPLFVGSFEDACNFNNEFSTTIPALYKLPDIENNIAEGVVIKPYSTDFFLSTGSRVIIKNKNEKWAENATQAKPTKSQRVGLTDEEAEQLAVINTFVTDNRLKNVLSKIGPVTKTDFGKILTAFVDDVKEDFIKDYDMYDYGQIFGSHGRQSMALKIRKNFLNIIDGNF